MKIFSILFIAIAIGCSASHPGTFREIVPAAEMAVHTAATNPTITAIASAYPPAAIVLAIAGLLTGGAAGHYTGRKTAAKKLSTPNPAAPNSLLDYSQAAR